MESEPSFPAKAALFIVAIWPYSWAILTSGIGPAVIMATASKYQDRLSFFRYFAAPNARPWIISGIFIVGFGYASFSAFDDVEARLRQAQNETLRANNSGSVEQQKAIDELKTQLSKAQEQITRLAHPPHDPNTLYQDDIAVASVQDVRVDAVQSMILIGAATASRTLNMSRAFELQDWVLVCSGNAGSVLGFGAMHQINYPNLLCRITGKH